MKKKVLIPIFLAAIALPLGFSKGAQGLNAEFIGETNNETTYKKMAAELNAQMADEGFVLLKNDGFLPYDTDGAKITIASKNSVSLARGGSGSGSGSVASGITAMDVYSSMEAVGCETNQTIKSFYNDRNKSGSGRTNGNNGWKGNSEVTIGETPASSYTQDILDSMDEYNDFAIQVITREGSEGCDVKTCNAHDSQKTHESNKAISDRHALQLSQNEEDLFNLLKEHFDHIIFVINSSNIFECDVLEQDEQVSAILWIGNPGDVGPGAIGRIISGQVNPSGHTVDTWARDFTLDPTYQNFSDNSQTNLKPIGGVDYYVPQDTMFNADGTPTMSFGTDKNYTNHNSPRWDNARGGEEGQVVSGGLNGVKPSAYVAYEEGVYLDYRYYETRYDDLAAEDQGEADAWYNGEEGVVYPFGYGLSYTEFEQEIVSCNIADKIINSGNAKVDVTVRVSNVGDVAGKEVVQLYWRAPYYDGEIEKASKVLCAFDKTDMLEPGEEQELTLSFYTQDVANYDFSDANGNGFQGYELDGGEYEIVLGKNAHEEIDSVKFQVAEDGIQYETDRFTGHEVKNRFTDRGFYDCLPSEDDFEFEQFSRTDLSQKPEHPTIDSRTLGADSRYEEFFNHEFSIAEIDVDHNYEYVPEAVYKTKEDIEALGWEQANGKTDVKFTDLLNTAIDDPRWDDFMNQLSWADMIEYVYGPSQHNKAISSVNKPATGDSDGPQRFRIIWWVSGPIVAATYNVELAKRQGECNGIEAHLSNNTYGWAGPGVNIHRSPFGGRNFEYYSADPFLTGRMAGRVVAGASDRGIYCYFKHFVVNDQEKNREGTSTFLTEQALREIYLKPFQMCVQEGKSMGLMSSYNRLGNMETAASYPLLTEVLREEWGFKGSIISDMTHSGNSSVNFKCYENINNRVLAGCDQQLDNGGGFKSNMNCTWDSTRGCPTFQYNGQTYESYTYWYAVRTNAQRVIWMCARSGVNSKTFIEPDENIELSNVTRGVFEGAIDEDIEIEVSLPDYFEVGEDFDDERSVVASEVTIDEFTPLPEGLEFDGQKITGQLAEPYNGFTHILVEVELSDGKTEKYGLSFELRVLATGDNAELEDIQKEEPVTPVDPVDPGQSSSEAPVASSEPASSAPEKSSEPASSAPASTPSSSAPASSVPASSTPAASSSENTPAKKRGCGGDIASVSALVGLIALAGIGFALIALNKKRRATK